MLNSSNNKRRWWIQLSWAIAPLIVSILSSHHNLTPKSATIKSNTVSTRRQDPLSSSDQPASAFERLFMRSSSERGSRPCGSTRDAPAVNWCRRWCSATGIETARRGEGYWSLEARLWRLILIVDQLWEWLHSIPQAEVSQPRSLGGEDDAYAICVIFQVKKIIICSGRYETIFWSSV